MRFSIIFSTPLDSLSLYYHSAMLSLLKQSFQVADRNLYNQFFSGNTIKPFTFSVYFPESQIKSDRILLGHKKEVILNFSTYFTDIGLAFYNGLLKHIHKGFSYKKGELELRLHNIKLQREFSIKTNKIVFKTLSPFVVRKHNKEKTSQKDSYLTLQKFSLNDLNKQLNINMEPVFEKFIGHKEEVELFLSGEQSLKSVLIKISKDNSFLIGNIGKFTLTGTPEALNLIYKAGLGSKRSFGFGMLEVVREKG